MHGYMGKILRVNLTEGKHSVEPLNEPWLDTYLGGRGLASRIYMDEVDPGLDPLSEENKLILCTGPMVGTGAISAGSAFIVTKSSLTHTIACAKTRGHFGAELKFSGYDGLIVEGKAETPVMLCLMDDKVSLRPALHLWGRRADEAELVFKEEMKDPWGARETYIAGIGPAGEKMLPIATVVNDGFLSVGGAGVGAVFGSKNLKGIAVKGQHSVKVADGRRLTQVVTTMIGKLNGSPITSELMPLWGAAFLVRRCAQRGMLPSNNFQAPSPQNIRNLGTEVLEGAFPLRSRGCFSCPIACLKKTDLTHPLFKGRGVAPTYMATGSLGTNCGITDLEAISRANMLCADMGLDPIATGGLFATIMELVEKGAVTSEQVKLDIQFGAAESLVNAIEMVATKKGHAQRLGKGARAVAEEWGFPESFVGVKGAPLASFDPRAIQGLGLHFATCNQGPHHAFAYTFIDELLNVHQEADPWEIDGKPRLVKQCQEITAAMDSLGFCNWVLLGLKFKNLVPMVNAVLGAQFSAESLIEIGERVWNLERMFNAKAGFTAKDDRLPERLTREPISEGPANGQVSRVPEMISDYYEFRGWSGDGEPFPRTLERLGLEDL
jgi:aldehyde:ferredoxin oxidoreductase